MELDIYIQKLQKTITLLTEQMELKDKLIIMLENKVRYQMADLYVQQLEQKLVNLTAELEEIKQNIKEYNIKLFMNGSII